MGDMVERIRENAENAWVDDGIAIYEDDLFSAGETVAAYVADLK